MKISAKEFMDVATKPCFYCGDLPGERNYSFGRTVAVFHRSVLCHGLDRVDNSKGYEIGNIVSCCTWCNRGKSTQPQDEFIKRCIRVANLHA